MVEEGKVSFDRAEWDAAWAELSEGALEVVSVSMVAQLGGAQGPPVVPVCRVPGLSMEGLTDLRGADCRWAWHILSNRDGGRVFFVVEWPELGVERKFYVDLATTRRRLPLMVALAGGAVGFSGQPVGELPDYFAVLTDPSDETFAVVIATCQHYEDTLPAVDA